MFHFGTIVAIVFVAALQGHNPEPLGDRHGADENAREAWGPAAFGVGGRRGIPFPPPFHPLSGSGTG